MGHHEREQCYARAPDPGRIGVIELRTPNSVRRSPLAARRSPLAAMTSARDGDFTKAPETGEGLAAGLGAMLTRSWAAAGTTTPN
ncbi:hypothetical protein [Streptomyces longhuiensis]|uniref:hypothetical protein n=1 Tax=Streptomyces longhuiensis TaxID=2880933 RepID=UPI001D09D834|nr:hypothetical protein [Streptomyces longhuiensis]UDL99805.1 hypothetical protein LGI35_16755 [Streptomyces longhuiensis]